MNTLILEKYSFGVGDRFAHQAPAQLDACVKAAAAGVEIVPVWNKSNREHNIIGSEPASTRAAADAAVKAARWTKAHYVDADHINLGTVDRFMAVSDFFTIDVADYIGKPAEAAAVEAFAGRHPELMGEVRIEGVDEPFAVTAAKLRTVAAKYLFAIQEAGKIYRHIEAAKGKGGFVPEVSMDETDAPQTPEELAIILAAIADEGIPIQTIAPKFAGRFNKGVDYVGDVAQFEREFRNDLAVIAYAVKAYGLPANLKLSVHSGSDKFSIYGPIRRALRDTGAGVHLKTAGTTWLEELIGMAEAGGDGLALAKEVYADAHAHQEELCAPYASVIDINPARLPDPAVVAGWPGEEYASALRHDQSNPQYNADVRQLLHVGYKVAAKMGERYLAQLRACEADIARNVTTNLFDRHVRPLFLD
ncbi:MAG: tagaturonate epimerase family protein [Bryobacteraceae bacterium]